MKTEKDQEANLITERTTQKEEAKDKLQNQERMFNEKTNGLNEIKEKNRELTNEHKLIKG